MSILADRNTRVIIQGITGREAASFTRDMLDYGTRVVAGVTPGKGGQQVHGVPVHDTVRQAVREEPAEASVISVPPRMVLGAALEALEEAGVEGDLGKRSIGRYDYEKTENKKASEKESRVDGSDPLAKSHSKVAYAALGGLRSPNLPAIEPS